MRVRLLSQDWNGNIMHLILQLNTRLSSRSWNTCHCCQWDPSLAFLIEMMWGTVMLAFFHKTCKCVRARKARGCSCFFCWALQENCFFWRCVCHLCKTGCLQERESQAAVGKEGQSKWNFKTGIWSTFENSAEYNGKGREFRTKTWDRVSHLPVSSWKSHWSSVFFHF